MRRYTAVEAQPVKVLTPQQHEAAETALRIMGKQSASDLTDSEREVLRVALDETR